MPNICTKQYGYTYGYTITEKVLRKGKLRR